VGKKWRGRDHIVQADLKILENLGLAGLANDQKRAEFSTLMSFLW
jgi:hypothetical protein